MDTFSGILDILFPRRCVFCAGILKRGEESVCARCAGELPYTSGAAAHREGDYFEDCVVPLRYEGQVRKSLHRFKFRGASNYADCYGAILASCIRETLDGRYDLISWVPLSPGRKRARGYDQAMLLACAAALELDNVAVETLRKDVEAQAQSTMGGKDQRRANISGAYSVVDRELIAEKRILLIDDIVTTGSTLSECAKTLLLAGAESVVCAALAGA